MKFAVAVVLLVLAATAQSSVIGPLGLGLGLGGITPWGGLGLHGPPAAVAVHASNPWGLTGLGVPGISLSRGLGPLGLGIPGIALSQGIGPVAAPLGLGLGHGVGHEGVYVAKTRGAIHTAPLAGHIASAASINVAPAPGTL